jgi:hypothetical protein
MEPTPTLGASKRHPLDWLQVAAVVCVVGLIAGEVILLMGVFQQHRSRRMLVEASDLVTATAPVLRSVPAVAVKTNVVPVGVVVGTNAVALPVLNPAVKVQRVLRTDEAKAVLLQVRLRAQTGEAQFDPRAAAVCVEWLPVAGAAQQQWLAVPVGWENFMVEMLNARFEGTPAQLGSWVVRTFYRGQLQDSVASKPSF